MSSVFHQDYPFYEIILVDNGSSDGSAELMVELAHQHPNVPFKIIRNTRNIGYSLANNQGVSAASGKYIVLLSNDIKVEPDWLSSTVGVLESRSDIAVAQNQMYSLFSPMQHDVQANYLDVIGLSHTGSPSPSIKTVFYAEGACMFIRREALDEVGELFDSRYIMFNEDIDFCWRVKLMGYKVCVIPASKVYHARGGTVTGVVMKTQPLFAFSTTRNRLITLFKNYELLNLVRFLPLATSYELAKATWLILNRRHRAGLSCLRGVAAFFVGLPVTCKKRSAVQQMRKVQDRLVHREMLSLSDALRFSLLSVRQLRGEWQYPRKRI